MNSYDTDQNLLRIDYDTSVDRASNLNVAYLTSS